jgi:uncharacterized protein
MGFLEELLARCAASEERVRGVWIGPYWTVAQTEGGIGLASTQLAEGPTHGEHAQSLAGAGALAGRLAAELARGVSSGFALDRSVGLAVLNALVRPAAGALDGRNAGELLAERGAGKTVGVVGWFPFIPGLRQVAAAVETFEKDSRTGYDLTPSRAKALARCDVLCVTASTLVNGTLDALLQAANPRAWKALVGPSAPLCEEALALGFDAVCGARVLELGPIVRVVQEGGCFRQIRRTGAVELATLLRRDGAASPAS